MKKIFLVLTLLATLVWVGDVFAVPYTYLILDTGDASAYDETAFDNVYAEYSGGGTYALIVFRLR